MSEATVGSVDIDETSLMEEEEDGWGEPLITAAPIGEG